ncbi:MAG: hypothetical protein R2752_17795 [Vicinamibacterales bacterium]
MQQHVLPVLRPPPIPQMGFSANVIVVSVDEALRRGVHDDGLPGLEG